MADKVDSRVLFSGTKKYVVRITNESDGTGESGVVKVDKSTLTTTDGAEPSKFVVDRIEWTVTGFNYVTLAFDHDTDDELAVLSGSGYKDYEDVGGLSDPASSGGTGDIILTTDGAFDGASYDITLYLRMKE